MIRPTSPGESLSAICAALTGEEASKSLGSFVDIHDLAAVILAAFLKEAGKSASSSARAGIASSEISALRRGGEVEVDEAVEHQVDSSKARRLLNFAPRSKRETFHDTVPFLTDCLHLQDPPSHEAAVV